jgi:hypothetical protein
MDWNWLFDASQFLNRNHSGLGWTSAMEISYKVSNVVIALAYFEIPVILLFLWRKTRDALLGPSTLILFLGLIVLCGLTHLSNALVFHRAPYRFSTGLHALTALAAAVTAFRLPHIVRQVVKLPSREYVCRINRRLQDEVRSRARAEQELAGRNERLRARVKTLEEMLKANSVETLEGLLRTNQWIHERNAAIQELNQMLTELEAL